MTFRIYGLTGNLASGKSTVGRMLRERGVPVVDADQVARDVVAKGTPGLEAVAARFPGVLAADGTLDRKALAARVFGDAAERKALEGILHPLIGGESLRRLRAHAEEGAPFAVYEATLLVENRLYEGQDGLIVVTARPEAMLARAMARDGLSLAEAQARLQAQLSQEAKAKVADFVIRNDSDLPHLVAQVEKVLERLRAGYTRGS